ncbi:MAG: DUF1801 domain-containing protein [Patescibacteria group bacterium]
MKTTSVDTYIAGAPAWAKPTLRQMRQAIRTAAPKAEEKIGYGMPYYSFHGRLAYFAAFKNHCSFFWLSASDKKTFAKECAPHKVVGSTLHIPIGAKVPVTLIKKLVRARAKANQARKK